MIEAMANHRAKGVEYIRAIGRRGGVVSGEGRRYKMVAKALEMPEIPALRSQIAPADST
jgi:hypothetical protein